MRLEIRQRPFDAPESVALNDGLQAEYQVRYGGSDETPVAPQEFASPHGAFFVAYLDGEPVGCGGFRTVADGVGEIKRMYVTLPARGRGIARKLLAALEQAAVAAGCSRVILETGSQQPEADKLYTSSGFTAVPPFGIYRCEPGSRHLGKALTDMATGLPDESLTSRTL